MIFISLIFKGETISWLLIGSGMEPQSPAPTLPGWRPTLSHFLTNIYLLLAHWVDTKIAWVWYPKMLACHVTQLLKLKEKMISLANCLLRVLCNQVGNLYSVPNILLYTYHFILSAQKPSKAGDLSSPSFATENGSLGGRSIVRI